jgi:hypothetical protein
MTTWSAFSLRRMAAWGPAQLADHVEKEHDRLSGDHWLAHVMRMGLLLLVLIGVPIGLLLAASCGRSQQHAPSRSSPSSG